MIEQKKSISYFRLSTERFRKVAAAVILLVIPLIFAVSGLKFERAKYAADPNYIYLMNALSICLGTGIGHIDNPGTTVMQVEAATIAIAHFLDNPEKQSLADHVFDDSDKFIEATRRVFIIMNSLAILCLGFVAWRRLQLIWPALLLQAAPFFSEVMLDHIWSKVSPEPVLVFVSAIYLIIIILFYTDKNSNPNKYIWLFALVTGAGLGTKATFLPLIIFPLIVLPAVKRKLLFLSAVAVSFVLFTIPAIPEYKQMYYWFKQMLTHTGQYGGGNEGFIDFSTYFPNILKIVETNPVFATILIAGVAVFIYQFVKKIAAASLREKDVPFKILTGLIATSIFGILMVAKQYHSNNHYLIPVIMLSGATLFFAIRNLPVKIDVQNKILIPVCTIVLTLFLIWQRPPQMKNASEGYHLANMEMDSTEFFIRQKYPDYRIINYYPESLTAAAGLHFGDVYAKQHLQPLLKEKFPDTWFYNFHSNELTNWYAKLYPEDIIPLIGTKVLLTGMLFGDWQIQEMENRHFPLKPIYTGRVQAIYELDSVRLEHYRQKMSGDTILIDFCGAETLNADNTFYTGVNGGVFGHSHIPVSETARTGEKAFKIDRNTEYTLEYTIDSLFAGDKYMVEAWRKSDRMRTRLVVQSEGITPFHVSEGDYIRKDENGWAQIRLIFQIPENLEGQTLKVFIWNRRADALIDDISIKRIDRKKQQNE